MIDGHRWMQGLHWSCGWEEQTRSSGDIGTLRHMISIDRVTFVAFSCIGALVAISWVTLYCDVGQRFLHQLKHCVLLLCLCKPHINIYCSRRGEQAKVQDFLSRCKIEIRQCEGSAAAKQKRRAGDLCEECTKAGTGLVHTIALAH